MLVPSASLIPATSCEQIERFAAGDVDRAADGGRRIGREQVAMHDVFDVREIARLLAVAKNSRPAGRPAFP